MRKTIFIATFALVAAACSGTTATSTSATSSDPATTVVETTTTTAGTTTAVPETTTTPQPPETTTTAAPETTTTLPPFPPARQDLQHGGETWVVVLAAAEDFNAPALDAAVQAASDAGYATGATDCDMGAAAVVGLPEDTHVYSVSVYLETEADAAAALTAFEARSVTGDVGTVMTFCLD
jgi:ABC-type Fe3+-hydroxamate transport system substrate-binding protein